MGKIFFDSTQKLYQKIGKEEIKGLTVPAFNIRTLTYDTARVIFRTAKKNKVGAFIIELAESEIDYTNQSFKKYSSVVFKAAKKENFKGPIFLQGDHFKIGKDLGKIKKLIKEAVKVGFYNIDIDGSNLPIKENYKKTAEITSFIRKIEPKRITISIGGEIGIIGGENTKIFEYEDFISGYRQELLKYGDLKGLIKVAIQTGTSHGGLMLSSGKLEEPKEDFEILATISQEARRFKMAGAVQHGASTLPDNYFKRFPEIGCCEIHLATAFQNVVFESEYFPEKLRERIYNWLKEKYKEEKKKNESEIQFIYRLRKNGLGPFKKEISKMPRKNINKICEELGTRFEFFFKSLNVCNTSDLIKKIYN